MLREKLAEMDVEQKNTVSDWLGGSRRWVSVTVVDRGHEVDAFEASSPKALTLALTPILTHLSVTDTRIDFIGLSTRWGPFGLRRHTEVTPLADRAQALAYLDGVSAFAYPRPYVQDTSWLGKTMWEHDFAKRGQARVRPRPRKTGQAPSRQA